jgi:two-component system, NtrC family, response regulator AtoC
VTRMGQWHRGRLFHMEQLNVLVVEDDESLRRATQAHLKKAGYRILVARDVPEALRILGKNPVALVVCNLKLPGQSGLDMLKTVRSEYPGTLVVMVTAHGSGKSVVEAMKSGAYDYLTKPVHPYVLTSLVNRIFEQRRLMEEVLLLRGSLDRKYGFESIIGHSPSLLYVLDSAARVAQTDATVLIRGETGTGKEVLAKAVHFHSPRRERPFVTINCGAIPRELLESELFGHVRGAFTGAMTHKKGKVEMADGGTVFLDEIGELPLDLQVRVLRLLQEREIEKIGATHPLKVDVRIIAATNRDLAAMVGAGTFRRDLFYRLMVVPIDLPALRDRAADIPDFVQYFFEASRRKHRKGKLRLPSDLLPYFTNYEWPGNVRELENVVERIVILCRSDELTVKDLPDFLQRVSPGPNRARPTSVSEGMTLEEVEREMLAQALRKFNGNQSAAARHLQISRKTLLYRAAKHGIQLRRVKTNGASAG